MRGGDWKDKLTKGLAWASYVLGIAAGSLLASTFFGGILDTIFGALPWDWAAPAVLLLLFVFVAVDLLSDFIPNRLALYCTMAMPSVGRSVDGKLGDNIESWAGQVRSALEGDFASWLGTASALGLAVAASGAAWIVARRTMAAKAAGGR
jgi:hypothetical protein